MKIKKILVSQPQPTAEKSPYAELAERYQLTVDFRPFIRIEGVTAREIRQHRVDILAHDAIFMTSKTAVDHFFRICEELRLTVPDTMRYFCTSESIANYLQKYIIYRKRKIFFAPKIEGLMDMMQKHKESKILLPLSDPHKPEIPRLLDRKKFNYTKAIFYRSVFCDLSDIKVKDYDMLVYYSPMEIKSLLHNCKNFEQGDTMIACFGPTTVKAAKEAGLRIDIQAPTTTFPSMTMAIEHNLKAQLKKEQG